MWRMSHAVRLDTSLVWAHYRNARRYAEGVSIHFKNLLTFCGFGFSFLVRLFLVFVVVFRGCRFVGFRFLGLLFGLFVVFLLF